MIILGATKENAHSNFITFENVFLKYYFRIGNPHTGNY